MLRGSLAPEMVLLGCSAANLAYPTSMRARSPRWRDAAELDQRDGTKFRVEI
jgi:hypothetical protein